MAEKPDLITDSSRRASVKRGFRLFFCSLTWIGLLGLILSSVVMGIFSIHAWSMTEKPSPLGLEFAIAGIALTIYLGVCGILAILIFGFIGRHRHFWIGAIAVGTIYIVAFSGWIPYYYWTSDSWAAFWKHQLFTLVSWVPGILAIVLGILFKKFPKAEILKA